MSGTRWRYCPRCGHENGFSAAQPRPGQCRQCRYIFVKNPMCAD